MRQTKYVRLSGLIILLCSSVSVGSVFAQDFNINYTFSVTDISWGVSGSYLRSSVVTSTGTYAIPISTGTKTGSIVVSGYPQSFSVSGGYKEKLDHGWMICDESNSTPISSNYCTSAAWGYNGVCQFKVNFYNITVTPVIPITGTIGTYCSESSIALSGSSGFSSYRWQYSSSSSNGYQDIRTTVGNSTNISFSDVSSIGLNNNIYFRYSVGNCDPNSVSSGFIGPFVFAPQPISVPSYSTIKPTCQDGSDGSVTVSLDRGLLSGETVVTNLYAGDTYDPSTYVPNTQLKYQANGTTVSDLQAGTYYALIKSNFGSCAQVPVFTPVTIPSGPRTPLTASLSITSNYNGSQLSCNNASDGQVTVSTNGGGNGTYQYSIDGGTTYQPSNIFTGVSAGSYSATVKDGCVNPTTASTNSVTLTAPSLVSISSLTPSFCNGTNNGQITVSATGGTGTLSYSKDGTTFQGSNLFTNLTTGTSYTITVKDQNNCSTNGSVLVPSQLNAGATSITHPTCSSTSTGSVSINGSSGGTGSLTWSIGSAYQSVSTPFTNVSPGTYSVTVQDGNGCTASAGSVTINQPITASYSTTVASCATVNDGTITVTGVAGGTNTFQYALNSGPYQASNFFSGLASGTYTVNVKDGNGCILSINSVAVGVKTPVSGSITQTSLINCFGQTTAAFNVVASGGTPPFTSYSWSNGASGTSVSNVGAGTYTVSITDSKGCQGAQSILITQPTQLTGSTSASNYNGFNVSCKGGNNGTISLTPSGATSPYTYSWSTGSNSQNLTGLTVGSYSVTITDAKNCTATKNVTLTEPASSVSAVLQLKSDVTCFGANNGVISILGSGGTGALSYSLDGGVTYQLSPTFTSLAAGSYSVIAKDANNCTATSPTIIINTPTALNISSITKGNPLCNGSANGSLVVTTVGGTTSYQYSKDGINFSSSNTLSGLTAGSYVVTVKDANGCTISSSPQALNDPTPLTVSATSTSESFPTASDGKIGAAASGGTGVITYSLNGINFQQGVSFTGLTSGTYTVTVKDQNSCLQTALVVVPSAPPPPSSTTCPSGKVLSVSTASQVDPTCGLSNGSVQAIVSGGSGTYTFQWFDNLFHASGSSATLQNVPSGTYSVRITDSNLCVVGVSVSFAAYPLAQFNLTNIGSTACNYSADGSAAVQVGSVQSPYTVLWSSGETTATANKLVAGQNTVTITDINHCQITKTVQIPSPPSISILSETILNPVCVGGTGSIQITATGGTGNFTYSWNGVTGQNNIQNVKAGVYSLTIKDNNGCSFTKGYTLNDPPPFIIDLGTDKTICPNTSTTLGLTLPNATYVWSGPNNFSSTQGIISTSDAGKYFLTVTNTDGCKASNDVTITISNNLLKADFLSVSQSHVGDTIILVDISWPIPDQVQWHLSDSATVIYSDKDYALISFSKPDIYSIGVGATLGGCQNQYFQKIIIDDKPSGGSTNNSSGSTEIVLVTAYPNPFDSKTNAHIELSKVAGVTMKVYSLVTNLLIMQNDFVGDSKYDIELDFSGQLAGLYIIIVESGSKTKAVRVIKL